MKPHDGEFWIVEFEGNVTIGRCGKVDERVDGWTVIGAPLPILTENYVAFRALRKIDIGASLDQSAARSSAVSAEPMASGRYEFPYNRTFQAIAAATSVYAEGVGVNVSVNKFQEAFNSYADARPLTEPQSASLAVDRDLLRRMLGYARNAICPFSGQPEVDNWHSRSDADCRYLDALLSVPAEPQCQAVSAPTAAEPDRPRNDPKVLARLLRAIAGGENAKASQHDVIFKAAAAELERQNVSAEQSEFQAVADLRDQLGGVQRMLWLVIKAAGAPGGVWIDKEDVESFDHNRAQLYAETNLDTGAVHVEARTKENDQ